MNKFLAIASYIVILCVSNVAFAYANSQESASQFVKDNAKQVIDIVASGSNEGQKNKLLTDRFNQVMDIDWMGKFVVGKAWSSWNEEQKVSYLQNYRSFLVSSYVPLFRDYNGQKVNIKGSKAVSEGQYVVQTEIYKEGGESAPIKVEYRLKYEDGGFKVRDIIAEGVSMLSTQRSDFGSILTSQGFNSLIKNLKEKAAN